MCSFFTPLHTHTQTCVHMRTSFLIEQCCRTVSRNTNWKKSHRLYQTHPLFLTHTPSALPLHALRPDTHALWLESAYIYMHTHAESHELGIKCASQVVNWKNKNRTLLCKLRHIYKTKSAHCKPRHFWPSKARLDKTHTHKKKQRRKEVVTDGRRCLWISPSVRLFSFT